MHFGDSIFIFLLALVLFGPKRLPEIGRQIGKLLAEFRRASNEFKMQIDEELRAMEQQERQKQLDAAAAKSQTEAAAQLPAETTVAAPETAATPSIMPPKTGEPVSAEWPYNKNLPVEEIDPGYQAAEAKENEAARAAVNGTGAEITESEQAPIHHG
ncbi:Sec-independent protein translocase subunit TatA/TatB [Alloacidobacterium sp.]|uniref:Sec-independent protein translocase subunit TatA/TatB n=1 Tax=Alloacidobacterium sp. TaxID=2951999 RepID=UPI002D7419B0|nr:twin-arginine translocase TatA/TatE family subunit [Alloacidobacterium sp.]HYK34385.1 twin-arginine translocase TatA/TatE family subunit [Alloacidobacterium sp.]